MEGIKIRGPVDVKIAQGVKDINQSILQGSFVTLIVGKPGCGKSHLLREFIMNKDLYYRKFKLILFITPSKFEDKEIELDERNHKPDLDIEWIHNKLNRYKEFVESEVKDNSPVNILLILDDVIGEIRKNEHSPRLIQLFFNRRHLLGEKFLISILLTSQKYVVCPPKIRSILTSVIAFPLMKMDWRKLEEECIYDTIDKRFLNKLFVSVNSDPFVFIYIRLDNGKIFYKFEKCINSL